MQFKSVILALGAATFVSAATNSTGGGAVGGSNSTGGGAGGSNGTGGGAGGSNGTGGGAGGSNGSGGGSGGSGESGASAIGAGVVGAVAAAGVALLLLAHIHNINFIISREEASFFFEYKILKVPFFQS